MITELEKQILCHSMLSTDEFIDNIYKCGLFTGREEEIIRENVNARILDLRRDWTATLEGRGLIIPQDDFEFSELVFSQPDYKSRAERDAKTPEQLLKEAKEEKIQTLKSNRDNANLRPMVSIKAPELIGEMGSKTFGNLVYFSFDTKATNNPATEPNSIVFATILNGLANPNYYTQYSTIIIEGDSTRKGYVAITPTVAGQLAGHAAHRNTMNIEYCNQQEVLIKAVSVYFPEGHEQAGQLDINSSLEALNQINITY